MKGASRKKKRKKRVGIPPGTLMPLVEGSYTPALKTLFEYNSAECSERTITGDIDFTAMKNPSKVSWLNVDGTQDSRALEQIGTALAIHPLVLEDIQNPDKRPTIESHEDYMFIVFKMLRLSSETSELLSEQVSLVLGRGYVISFQERVGDVFDYIRDRLRTNKGRLRRCGADYLAYSLVDAVVDNYFEVVESLDAQIEELEDRIIDSMVVDFMPRMHFLRHQYVTLRRAIWPLREMIHEVLKDEHDLIDEATNAFYRDVYDHIVEVSESVDSFRDALKGLLDIHNTQQNKQLNATMKVLTIISTIFIPPTFLVGVYGMNFHFMPELSWKWGYPLLWIVMVGIGLGMVAYFRRKKWF
jgi:magnesium transporter